MTDQWFSNSSIETQLIHTLLCRRLNVQQYNMMEYSSYDGDGKACDLDVMLLKAWSKAVVMMYR